MMLDKFKHWELNKESSKNSLPSQGSVHRNMRLNFFQTSKYDVVTALLDPKSLRPFIINSENAKKIVFDVNRDMYINVEYESKSNIFLWKDLKDIDTDDFLINEMVKFQDACNEALEDMIKELSEIKRVPLAMRYEKPKKIENDQEPEEGGMFDLQPTNIRSGKINA
jgi:hypothetical protein